MIKYTDDEVNHSPGSGRVTFSQNFEIGQYIKNTLKDFFLKPFYVSLMCLYRIVLKIFTFLSMPQNGVGHDLKRLN